MIPNLATSPHSKRPQSNRSSKPSPSRRPSDRPTSTRTPSSSRTLSISRPSSHSGTQRADTKASPSLVSLPTLSTSGPESEREGYMHMAEPISPTPTRKAPGAARRGLRVPRARGGPSRPKPTADEVEVEAEAEVNEDADEDELFGLLGVVSPPVKPVDTSTKAKKEEGNRENGRKGVLAISKADIEASGSKGGGKTAGRKDEAARPREGQREKGEGASGRAGAQTRSRAPQAETMPHSESDTPLTDTPRSRSSTPKPRQPKSRNSTKPPPQPGSAARPISGLSAQLAAHPSPSTIPNTASYGQAITPSTSASSAFDTSSLSRSLPSEALFAPPKDGQGMGISREMGMMVPTQAKGSRGRKKKGGESEDESRIWDAPLDPGPQVAEDMTWQQRLGSYPNAEPQTAISDSSRPAAPSANSTSSGKTKKTRPLPAPSPLNPSTSTSHIPPSRPGHSRRSSADTLPSHTRHLSFPLQPAKPSHPPSAYPLSTFDTLPPFNPAMNVHRAPQTPAKGGLARKYAVMELPLLKGGFPRLNGEGAGLGGVGGSAMGVGGSGMGGGGGGSLGTLGQGSNYAGASFHNSPHGRALPKPDMEDF